jgi:hypothetical protein
MPRPAVSSLCGNVGLVLTTALLAAALATGCGSSVSALSKDGGTSGGGGKTGSAGGSGATGNAGNGSGSAGASGATGAGGVNGMAGATGAGGVGVTQCTDGIDNDHDGLIDSADPECTGSADNDEGSFATGISGDNMDACKQDCFFDGNSGMGDDGCQWQLQCDPQIKTGACVYDPSYVQKHSTLCSGADISQKCIDNCRKYVPNGCDCFGCCAVPGSTVAIRLTSTCTSKDLNDPTKCMPCTQVTQCMNTCGRCELCVGKTSVPADCGPVGTDGGTPPGDGGTPADGGMGTPQCEGAQTCVAGPVSTCPDGTGCVTGCCIPIVQ